MLLGISQPGFATDRKKLRFFGRRNFTLAPMTPPVLIDRLQVRTAMFAITRSTLRSQGAPGMVECARLYLRQIDLQEFSVLDQKSFESALKRNTKFLADKFPNGGKGNWGAARKSINIFLRDVLYCRPLCEHFKLSHIEPWLEVPLDSNVYAGLQSISNQPDQPPPWLGVKRLTEASSMQFQKIASSIAHSLGISRVHLDVLYFRKEELDALN